MTDQVVKDETMPEGKWAFDAEVATAFDNMLSRSIPQYEVMRALCFDLACLYRQPQSDLVDLGCSRGEAIAPLVAKYQEHNRYVGVEVSAPMLEAARSRFADNPRVSIIDLDLRETYPRVSASVTLCVLTLQFTPIEYRQRILRDIWKATRQGGALIIVEKVLGSTAELDQNLVGLYYAMKSANGYSDEAIQRKRHALEGVLVPVTARWNEDLLAGAGFKQIECFWRWCNFAGWLAVKW